MDVRARRICWTETQPTELGDFSSICRIRMGRPEMAA
jgi:hypothetical protein